MSAKQDKQSKPLAVSKGDQAPVIPFAPYEADPHPECAPGYSATLVEKSNELAREIWPSKEAYQKHAAIVNSPIGLSFGTAIEKENSKYFSRQTLHGCVNNIFKISRAVDTFTEASEIGAMIKKLKRLEKQYDEEEIFGYEKRESLIENVLLPTPVYGSDNHYDMTRFLDLRWPASVGVVNNLITKEEMATIENILNFIPRIRGALRRKGPDDGILTTKELLTPLMKEWSTSTFFNDGEVLRGIKRINAFIRSAIPYEVTRDYIPLLNWPLKSVTNHDAMTRASTYLRGVVIAYIQEQQPLSALLEAIIALSEAVVSYYHALIEEIEAGFNYLNRVGVSFETLVKESEQRIDDSQYPF